MTRFISSKWILLLFDDEDDDDGTHDAKDDDGDGIQCSTRITNQLHAICVSLKLHLLLLIMLNKVGFVCIASKKKL